MNPCLAYKRQAGTLMFCVSTLSIRQLWRLDQLADGSWRIMPKAVPNSKEAMALTAIGASFATLEKFDPSSNKQHWLVNLP